MGGNWEERWRENILEVEKKPRTSQRLVHCDSSRVSARPTQMTTMHRGRYHYPRCTGTEGLQARR